MKVLLSALLLIFMAAPACAGDLVVFAASSLRESFTEIGYLYEQQHGQQVRFNFAGSQALRTQIELGAPADLFAAANPMTIDRLAELGLVAKNLCFCTNRLILLLSQNAPRVNQLADLAADGVQIALGKGSAPIGHYTRQLLSGLEQDKNYGPELIGRIRRNVRTEESSVKAVVAKVLLDEVDAGIVYQSDLTPQVRAKTTMLALPSAYNPLVRYPVAVLRSSNQAAAARKFLTLLLSPTGQQVLRKHGFSPLPEGNKR